MMGVEQKQSYTKEEYEIAKNVSCIEYLNRNGYQLVSHGSSHFKLKDHDSFVVTKEGDHFWWNSKDISGNAITLVMNLENVDVVEAVKSLSSGYSTSFIPANNSIRNKVAEKQQELKKLELPEKNQSCNRVYWYLTEQRKLNADVVNYAINKGLIYQDMKGNAVFVSKDKNNIPKFACFRGTYEKVYRGDIKGSDKSFGFSFVNKQSNVVNVAESVIDTLSWVSLNGNLNENYLSLNSVTLNTLDRFLKENPHIDTIVTGLDNDKAGREATKKIWDTYKYDYKMKYRHILTKDLNEELVTIKSETYFVISECSDSSLVSDEKQNVNNIRESLDNVQGFFYAKIDVYQGDFLLYENIEIHDKSMLSLENLYDSIANKTNIESELLRDKILEAPNDKELRNKLLDMKTKVEMFEKSVEIKSNNKTNVNQEKQRSTSKEVTR